MDSLDEVPMEEALQSINSRRKKFQVHHIPKLNAKLLEREANENVTRKHSSRMRTACLLTGGGGVLSRGWGKGAFQGVVLSITGSDIITPPPPLCEQNDRQV